MGKEELYREYIENTYEELAKLGEGTLGKTFLARHRSTGKIVVKKTVSIQTGKVYEKLKELHHPNFVKIYDICFLQSECVIIEEYVSGDTLENVLQELKILSEPVVRDYLMQILQALDLIHKQGIVHRDLTPANILISTDGVVKIIDFGISREQKENQTKDTTILGTVGYASPEQFGFRQTDDKTDIYALGIVLNVMLTGKLPNEKMTQNEFYREIVEKCTQLDPVQRYGNVKEIIRQIEEKDGINKKSDLEENAVKQGLHDKKKDYSIWPGFRSNQKIKQVIAILGYGLMLLMVIASVSECGMNLVAIVLEVLALTLYMILPFVIITDFGRWSRRWKPFCDLQKAPRITLKSVMVFFCFYGGIMLDNYVRYNILGIVPK